MTRDNVRSTSAVDVDLSAVAWGQSRTMSDFETGMWRMEEVRPELRTPIVAVDILDKAAGLGPVGTRARVGVAHRAPGSGCGPWNRLWGWATRCGRSIRVRLDYHLRRIGCRATGATSIMRCASAGTWRPSRSTRPVRRGSRDAHRGTRRRRAVYVVKTHHSITDGMGGIQMMALLHSRRPEPTPDKPDREPAPPEHLSDLGALGRDVVSGSARRRGDSPGWCPDRCGQPPPP